MKIVFAYIESYLMLRVRGFFGLDFVRILYGFCLERYSEFGFVRLWSRFVSLVL